MPSSSKPKIRRKDLKQPDEFITFVDTARDFVLDNLTQVITAVIIVVVAAAIVIGYFTYEGHLDRVSSAAFYNSFNALQARDYSAAQSGFQKLAREFPERRVGKLARFYLASAYLAQNHLTKARDALVAFTAVDHDPVFGSMAMTNLGVIYEREGEYRKAATAYAQAASVPGPEQIRAELGVARTLAKAGDRADAIHAYQQFLALHPFAEERQTAMEALAALGAPPAPQARVAPVPSHVIDVPPVPSTTH